MSVALTYQTNLTAVETIGTNAAFANANGNRVTYDGLNTSKTLNAGSTPPITKLGIGEVTLSSGGATIDLTSLLGTNGAAVTLTGLKPVTVKFKAKASNTHKINIAVGASNGHPLLGAAFSVDVQPGGEVVMDLGAAGTTVDGTHKTIDLLGNGTEALDYEIVAG